MELSDLAVFVTTAIVIKLMSPKVVTNGMVISAMTASIIIMILHHCVHIII